MDEPSSPTEFPYQLRGQLLLADPSLRQGIFHRSVILLAQHSPEEGAYGLILNHPTGKTVADFLGGETFPALKQLPVHHGGPVATDQLTFSSFWWSPKHGLKWAIRISATDAMAHAHQPGRIVRAFIGYSGWGSGQLENELQKNSWIPTQPPQEMLGHVADRSLWAALLRQLSPFHRILAESPDDPTLN